MVASSKSRKKSTLREAASKTTRVYREAPNHASGQSHSQEKRKREKGEGVLVQQDRVLGGEQPTKDDCMKIREVKQHGRKGGMVPHVQPS